MNPTRIQLRYDTLANWEESGTLNIGELGIAQKPDASVEARVGTANGQSWANAKPLSVSQDDLGLNIEELGRVFVILYLGEISEIELSPLCSTTATFNWTDNYNFNAGLWPKQSFQVSAQGKCSGQTLFQNIGITPFRFPLGGNIVGYQTNETNPRNLRGFVHKNLGNQIRCQELSNPVSSYSSRFPIRPVAANGARLIFLKNVEVWSLIAPQGQVPVPPSEYSSAYFTFESLVDGWFPDIYLNFSCGIACGPDGSCVCQNGTVACACSNGNCPCDGPCPFGTSPLTLEEIINNTDFDPEEYGIEDYFYSGTDNELTIVHVPYYVPRPITIQGYPFDKSVPTFDRTTKNWVNKYAATFDELEEGIVYWDIQDNEWKITDTLEGGIY